MFPQSVFLAKNRKIAQFSSENYHFYSHKNAVHNIGCLRNETKIMIFVIIVQALIWKNATSVMCILEPPFLNYNLKMRAKLINIFRNDDTGQGTE